MLHLTCWGYKRDQIRQIIKDAQRLGVQNILALRGDLPPQSDINDREQAGDFQYATQLVKFIREEFGDYFVIGNETSSLCQIS